MLEITCTDSQGNPLRELTQWDVNQKIYIKNTDIKNTPVVHFCNDTSENAYSVNSRLENGIIVADIPNVLLTEHERIWVYIYDYNDESLSGKTTYVGKILVKKKTKPDDYIFKEDILGVNISALNNKVKSLDLREQTDNTATNARITDLANNTETAFNAVYTNIANLDQKVEGENSRVDIAYEHSKSPHAPLNAQTNAVERIVVGTTEYKSSAKTIALPAYPIALPADGGNADTVNGHRINVDIPQPARPDSVLTPEGWKPSMDFFVLGVHTSENTTGIIEWNNLPNGFDYGNTLIISVTTRDGSPVEGDVHTSENGIYVEIPSNQSLVYITVAKRISENYISITL